MGLEYPDDSDSGCDLMFSMVPNPAEREGSLEQAIVIEGNGRQKELRMGLDPGLPTPAFDRHLDENLTVMPVGHRKIMPRFDFDSYVVGTNLARDLAQQIELGIVLPLG